MTNSDCCQSDDVPVGASVTRDDPGLDLDSIATCLDAQYDLRVRAFTFLPLGYDLNAAVYKSIFQN